MSGESNKHRQAKEEIARVLRGAGYAPWIEYSPADQDWISQSIRRRIDVALPLYRVAIEVWSIPAAARHSVKKARTEELNKSGWIVIDVAADNWSPESLVQAVRAATSRQSAIQAELIGVKGAARAMDEYMLQLSALANELRMRLFSLEEQIARLTQVIQVELMRETTPAEEVA